MPPAAAGPAEPQGATRRGTPTLMSTGNSPFFARPHILRQTGRLRLERFLSGFAAEFVLAATPLPEPGVSDEEFFCHWASALLHPETLPPRLTETLHALHEMATPEGQERLECGLDEAGVALDPGDAASRFDFALQAWEAARAVFAEQHRRLRLARCCRFDFYAGRSASGQFPASPGKDQLERMELELDTWFVQHRRGRHATRLECHCIDEELWFLVRHGDTFARTRAVKERLTEVLQYRPERDDVVVYSPAHDELRINARTRGERQLYREHFGRLLFGEREHFSEGRTYTLEPLREQGASALDVQGVPGIRRVTLRELKVVAEDGQGRYAVSGSADLFRAAPGGIEPVVAPQRGKLARAAFDFEFAGASRPRTVELVPPNVVKLSRHCDARIIGRFFCCRGFRRPGRARCSCASAVA